MKKLFFIVIVCLCCLLGWADEPAPAGAGILEDIAGVPGKRGYGGDSGDPLKARFANPTGIAIDRFHNIYIADTMNHRIRRIDARDGYIDTVAGTGKKGFFNDGGHADMAGLKAPTALILDDHGNLFIADTGNNRIRMVTPKGYIYTIAGNGRRGYEGDGAKAIATALNAPAGIAIGPDNAIYIADTGNHRIRKIDRRTGLLTTVAGLGTPGDDGDNGLAVNARLNHPTAIVFDKHGNLFIADTSNHKIRFIDRRSKRIFTLVGDGTEGYRGDNSGRSRDAWLNDPTGLALDRWGRIYVSDTDNQRIRRITINLEARDSRIETIVGTGTRGYNGDDMNPWDVKLAYPGAMVITRGDRLYFLDVGNNLLRRVEGISLLNPPTSYTDFGRPAQEIDSRSFYEVLFKPQLETAQN